MTLDDFESCLGAPTYRDTDLLLYAGDSLKLMQSLPSESLPLIVTSPPYNIGKEYEVARDINSYIDWTAAWTKEVRRIATSSGAFWLNLGYLALPGKRKRF